MEGYNRPQEMLHLSIDEEARGHLLETVRWTKFIAIVGFVFLGLLLLGALGMGTGITGMSELSGLGSSLGVAMMIVYLLVALLYFFPIFYLYKYSVLIKPAIHTSNQEQFNLALSYQRKMYTFIGVLCLVILGLYAVLLVFAIIGAMITGF